MERWLRKWAPLASVPAAALIIVSAFAGGDSPSDNAPVTQVVRFYAGHAAAQKTSRTIPGEPDLSSTAGNYRAEPVSQSGLHPRSGLGQAGMPDRSGSA
jgi:hypothetical protein